jgi:peptidoglycan/LPS O-acetylase OafA/YrhL
VHSSPSPELSRHTNNLDALRFGAAGMVILGHAYVLLGFEPATPHLFGVGIDRLGVYVFFTISGYLITKSWLRRPNWGSYFAARALRIFPGLIVVTLLTMFVLGPIVTTVARADYFAAPATWRYLLNAALSPVYGLPGVFETLPYPSAINGSLWTLPVEFSCYVLVPLILILPKVLRLPGAIAFGVLSAIGIFTVQTPYPVWGFVLPQAFEPWIYFAAGMVCALALQGRAFRLDVAVFALFVLAVASATEPQIGRVLSWFVLPYAILGLGLASTPVLRRASRFGDFSYGLYIYAFPVQQLLIHVVGVHSLAWNVPAVVLGTLVLSIASWWLVESPSLRLKVRVERAVAARPAPRAAGAVTEIEVPSEVRS